MSYLRLAPLRKTDTFSVHNGTKKIAEVRLQAGPPAITPHREYALTPRERQDITAFAECAR
jgi:hypothetical protein